MSYHIEILDTCPELPLDAPFWGSKKTWDLQQILWGSQLKCLAIWDQDQLIAWCFGLAFGHKFRRWTPIPFQPESGPYFNLKTNKFSSQVKIQQQIWLKIQEFCKQHFHQSQFIPASDQSRMALWAKADLQLRHTLIALPKQFQPHSDIRRQLKKAQSQGYVLCQATPKDAQHIIPLWASQMQAHKRLHPHFVDESIRLWEQSFQHAHFLQVCIRNSQGQVSALALCSYDPHSQKAWNLLNPCTFEAKKDGVAYMLYVEFLRQCAEVSTTLDLVGADDPAVSYFKEQFSSQLQTNQQITMYSHSFWKLLWNLRNRL